MILNNSFRMDGHRTRELEQISLLLEAKCQVQDLRLQRMDLRTRLGRKQPPQQQQHNKQSQPLQHDGGIRAPYRRDRITEDLLLDEGTLLEIQSLTGRELQRKMALLRELKSEYMALYEGNLQTKRETMDMLGRRQHRKLQHTSTDTAHPKRPAVKNHTQH